MANVACSYGVPITQHQFIGDPAAKLPFFVKLMLVNICHYPMARRPNGGASDGFHVSHENHVTSCLSNRYQAEVVIHGRSIQDMVATCAINNLELTPPT